MLNDLDFRMFPKILVGTIGTVAVHHQNLIGEGDGCDAALDVPDFIIGNDDCRYVLFSSCFQNLVRCPGEPRIIITQKKPENCAGIKKNLTSGILIFGTIEIGLTLLYIC